MKNGETIELTLTIKQTKIDVKVEQDFNRYIIHLLDLDWDITLTNALTPSFCNRVIHKLGYDDTVHNYFENAIFVCYHTDAEMSIYDPNDNTFHNINVNDKLVNHDFRRDMFEMYGS